MKDKKEPPTWDYFLTEYERDLLRLPFKDAMRKYPIMNREQMMADLQEMVQNHSQFVLKNGQN